MRSKHVYCFFILVLLFLLVVTTGCSENDSSNGNDEAGVVADDKVYEVKFNNTTPEVAPTNQFIKEWANTIEERSNGRIKFTHYWSNSLISDPPISPKELLLSSGYFVVGYYKYSRQYDLRINLPPRACMAFFRSRNRDLWQLLEEFEVLQDEYSSLGMKLYTFWRWSVTYLTSKKLVKTPDDMQGLRLSHLVFIVILLIN